MLEGVPRDGRLKTNAIIAEPTSRNTGIGLSLVGRLMKYKVQIVMPDGMNEEREKLIRALVGISSSANIWAARGLAGKYPEILRR